MQPVLIIQGGAGRSFKDSLRPEKIRKKISRILKLSYEKLVETDALEAVTHAVKLLEDDPEFNAGTGSQLQADGKARLSASIMDGSRECFAGVINIEKIKNPILVARALLEEKDRVLSGQGAFRFAKKLGFKPTDTRTKESIQRWKKWKQISSSLRAPERGEAISSGRLLRPFRRKGRLKESYLVLTPLASGLRRPYGAPRNDSGVYDTVGACALDRFGNLASATSTGGRGFEWPGRVSDSGMPVANYADSKCAISATGIGEEIIDEGLAIKIATRVQDGLSLASAFKKTFSEIRSHGRRIGAIGLDSKGRIACASTTRILILGWKASNRQSIKFQP